MTQPPTMPPDIPPMILGFERTRMREAIAALGESRYRGDQVFEWVHAHGVTDPEQMTNLPAPLRASLREAFDLGVPPVVRRQEAPDGTVKLGLGLADGWLVESVLVPREDADRQDQEERDDAGAGPSGTSGRTPYTLCVSTQVGCRVRCRFCRSGSRGLERNLLTAEIVAQVAAARGCLGDAKLSGIVFMGIGEPLDNVDALFPAIRILSDARGLGLALRRMVVSTVGLPDGIRALGEEFGGRVGLAVSLHAGEQEIRSALVRSKLAADVSQVLQAARDYPMPARDRVTVEVVLVRGVNDSPAQARALARQLVGLRCRVNLIPLNPCEGLGMEPPFPGAVERFGAELAARGLRVLVRKRKGSEILASCGQLAFGAARE